MTLRDGSYLASSGTTQRLRIRPARRIAAAMLVGGLAVTSLAACSGDDDPVSQNTELDDDGDGEVTPDEVMAAAKQHLDGTSGVEVRLSTGDEPDDGDYLASAEGAITADPAAFEGTVAGRVMGFEAGDIDVIAVGGDVYIKVPIRGWDTYDPEEFCAPDPALLLDPDTGVGPILTASQDLEAGDSERGGEDNDQVLTPYSGTVDGDSIRNILPCAEGDEFDATFLVDEDGQLTQVDLTGEFFSGMDEITYAIEVLECDVEQEITAPE